MFEQKKCYQLVNKVSGFGLLAGSWGTKPGDKKVYQFPLTETGSNPDGFVWLLIPAENDYYWIINKVSGFGLLAGSWGTKPGDRRVFQFPLTETGSDPDGFLWKIKKSDVGGYQIINKVSGFGLLAGSWGTKPGDRAVWQYPLSETGKNPDGFVWDIKFASDLPFDLTTEPGTNPNDIGDVERIKDFGHLPKEETDPVVIGEVLIPFFYVKDSNASPSSQVENDPYYKFKREGFWRRVFYFEHDGKTEREEVQETRTGLVKTSSKTSEDTMGIKVTAEAGFSYSGVSAKLSSSFSKELKVITSSSTTEMKEETKTIKTTFPKDERFVQALWMRADRYTLSRLSGDSIVVFEAVDPAEKIEDSYPRVGLMAQHRPPLVP